VKSEEHATRAWDFPWHFIAMFLTLAILVTIVAGAFTEHFQSSSHGASLIPICSVVFVKTFLQEFWSFVFTAWMFWKLPILPSSVKNNTGPLFYLATIICNFLLLLLHGSGQLTEWATSTYTIKKLPGSNSWYLLDQITDL